MSDGYLKVRRTTGAGDVSDIRRYDGLDRSRHGDSRANYHEMDRSQDRGGGGGRRRSSNRFSRDNRDVSDNRSYDGLDRSRHGDSRAKYHERDRSRERDGDGGGGGGDGRRSSNRFSRDHDGRERSHDSVDSEDMKRKRVPEERPLLPSSALGRAPVVRVVDAAGGGSKSFGVAREKETDQSKIARRLKQIKFGKNTLGYDNYTKTVLKAQRIKFDPRHPVTPDPYLVWSKRGFDATMQRWRVALHNWDPAGESSNGLDGLVDMTARSALSSPKAMGNAHADDGGISQSSERSANLIEDLVDYDDEDEDDGDEDVL